MKVDKASIEKTRKLLAELSNLEDAIDVLGNYDAKVSAHFNTVHNNNDSRGKTVLVHLPQPLITQISDYVEKRIFEIKKELESM